MSPIVNECSTFRGRCSDRWKRGGLLCPLRPGYGGATGQTSLQELRSLSHNPFCSLSLSKTVQSEPLEERLRESKLERLTWWLVNRLNCIMCCKKAHLIRQLFKALCLTISKGRVTEMSRICYAICCLNWPLFLFMLCSNFLDLSHIVHKGSRTLRRSPWMQLAISLPRNCRFGFWFQENEKDYLVSSTTRVREAASDITKILI